MFGRKPRAAQTAPTGPAPVASRQSGFVPVVTLVAAPDAVNNGRIAALQAMHGSTLNGQRGTAVGYDRGDPGMSLRAVIKAKPAPVAQALANVYHYTADPADSDYPDSLTTNPALDPYSALLFARMANGGN